MNERRFPGTEREMPSPEVAEKPVRRRFTAEYKLGILAEADACTERGSLGELLRREGLYRRHPAEYESRAVVLLVDRNRIPGPEIRRRAGA